MADGEPVLLSWPPMATREPSMLPAHESVSGLPIVMQRNRTATLRRVKQMIQSSLAIIVFMHACTCIMTLQLGVVACE